VFRISGFNLALIAVAVSIFLFTLCACAGAKAWEMYAEVKKSTKSLPYELVSEGVDIILECIILNGSKLATAG